MKLYNLNFHVNFFKAIFARLPPLASAARCGPHPSYPLATPVKTSLCRASSLGSQHGTARFCCCVWFMFLVFFVFLFDICVCYLLFLLIKRSYAGDCSRYRSMSPDRTALSGKPSARHWYCRSMGQTCRRTDGHRPLHRPCSIRVAYYAGIVSKCCKKHSFYFTFIFTRAAIC